MAVDSNKILQVNARHVSMYDSEDLNFFQKIMNDIVADCESAGALSANDKEYLKAQLAVAIFKCAETGERDYARLKLGAIEAVSPAPNH